MVQPRVPVADIILCITQGSAGEAKTLLSVLKFTEAPLLWGTSFYCTKPRKRIPGREWLMRREFKWKTWLNSGVFEDGLQRDDENFLEGGRFWGYGLLRYVDTRTVGALGRRKW